MTHASGATLRLAARTTARACEWEREREGEQGLGLTLLGRFGEEGEGLGWLNMTAAGFSRN
eukprot:757185-Hanusia_phi.AAC.2